MKTSYSCGLCALLALAAALLVTSPAPSSGQAQPAMPVVVVDPDLEANTALATSVAAQQAEITQNLAEIDKKIAAIGEEIRQARLFSARAGGAR